MLEGEREGEFGNAEIALKATQQEAGDKIAP